MKVKVVMFAVARDVIGKSSVELDLSERSTVGDLKKELVLQYPALQEVMARSAVSLDHEYAIDSSVLTENAEVALIPPVSGG